MSFIDRYLEDARVLVKQNRDRCRPKDTPCCNALVDLIDVIDYARKNPVAKVAVKKTGGNVGIAWGIEPVNPVDGFPLLPDGTLLFADVPGTSTNGKPKPPIMTWYPDEEGEGGVADFLIGGDLFEMRFLDREGAEFVERMLVRASCA